MSIMLAVLTDRSCGEACWHAKEEVCRCECGGINHGILLKDGATQPSRHSKIDGKAYQLIAVGDYRTINGKRIPAEKDGRVHRGQAISLLLGKFGLWLAFKDESSF